MNPFEVAKIRLTDQRLFFSSTKTFMLERKILRFDLLTNRKIGE
jgi:hypothetical protein